MGWRVSVVPVEDEITMDGMRGYVAKTKTDGGARNAAVGMARVEGAR